jgi:hypothetical protein
VDDTVVIEAARDFLDKIRLTFLMNHGLTPLEDTENTVTFKISELPRLKHYGYVPQELTRKRGRDEEEMVMGAKRNKTDLVPLFNDDYDVLSTDVLEFLDEVDQVAIVPEYFGQPTVPPPDEHQRSYYWDNEFIQCEGSPAIEIFAPFGEDSYNYHKYRATTQLALNVENSWNENYFWTTGTKLHGASNELDCALVFDLTKRSSKWMRYVYDITTPLVNEKMRIRNDLVKVDFTYDHLVFISVIIGMSVSERHANVLVIDNVHKKVVRFEPHGGYTRMYEMVTVDLLIKTWVNTRFPGYAYVPPSDFMFRDGIQVREMYTEQFSQKRNSAGRLQEAAGYCYAWVLMFIWVYERKFRTCNAREIYGFFDELTSDELASHVRKFMHYLTWFMNPPQQTQN